MTTTEQTSMKDINPGDRFKVSFASTANAGIQGTEQKGTAENGWKFHTEHLVEEKGTSEVFEVQAITSDLERSGSGRAHRYYFVSLTDGREVKFSSTNRLSVLV